MRVLIVVPDQDRVSGNWITARRFQNGLEKQNHQVALHGTQLRAGKTFRQELFDFAPDVTMLLHAYRSGRPVAWKRNPTAGLSLRGCPDRDDINHGLERS